MRPPGLSHDDPTQTVAAPCVIEVESILDRLWSHAAEAPDKVVYRFLNDDGACDTLTFGQLRRRVISLSRTIANQASPGNRALLLYPPGLEFISAFLACLAVGLIAVPAYPPRRNRKAERLRSIASDARPSLVLTTQNCLSAVAESELRAFDEVNIIATDAIETGVVSVGAGVTVHGAGD